MTNFDLNNGSSKKKYHLAFSALSRLPWIKIFLQQKLLTKYYLWASFEGIWSMSKLSKLDIQMAISAIKIKLRKKFFCRNVYHDVVAHVPNFQLSARSSSFFSAVFPSLSWTLFFGGPVIYCSSFYGTSLIFGHLKELSFDVLFFTYDAV